MRTRGKTAENLPLYDIIRTLSEEEISDFKAYLKSPYFNTNQTLMKAFEFIMKYYPDFSSKKLNPKNLSKKLDYPTVDEGDYFRKIYSLLVKKLTEFITIERFKKDEVTITNYLLEEFIKRNLPAPASKKINKIDKSNFEINLNSLRAPELSKLKNNIANFKFIFSGFLKFKKVSSYKNDQRESNEYQLLSAIAQIITHYVEEYTRNLNFNLGYDDWNKGIIRAINFEEILDAIDDSNSYKIIGVLYYKLLCAYMHFFESKYYFDYKNYFFEHLDKFDKTEISKHFLRLTNYCNLKRNQFIDFKLYSNELVSLYKEFLENDNFRTTVREYLPITLFRAILLLMLNQKELDYARKLINVHIFKFEPVQFVAMRTFGNALLSYTSKDNSTALTYLNKLPYEHYIFKYDAAILRIRITMEQGDFEYLNDLSRNFRRLLIRDTLLNTHHKASYRNFIKTIQAFYNSAVMPRSYKIDMLLKKIRNDKNLIHKEWFIETIENLIERKLVKRIA